MQDTNSVPRKPYQTPSLTVLGNVREVTRATNSMGQLDGGSTGGKTKTGT